jgi:3-oxoacyl-[acyl-carrier-protein] synthase II
VVTGIGVISAIGIGKAPFWSALVSGVSGIKQVSLFETDRLPCHTAGEAIDFAPEVFLGQKGLKYLDRSTQLAAAATSLALGDSGLVAAAGRRVDIGLVLGTTFGSVDSITGFDRQILTEGPRSVTPMAFPRTVINSPAGHVAIRFGLAGLNATLAAGSVSSLQAIAYAADFVELGRADVLLAGGVEELAQASYAGYCAAKWLSGACGGCAEHAAPFDVQRSGLILGEGAAVLAIESAEHAAARGAAVYAEVRGFGATYGGPADNGGGSQAARAILRALEEAATTPDALGAVCAGANGSRVGDDLEARAIGSAFGGRASALPIYSIKGAVGEALGASGALQVASAVLAMNEGVVPPTTGFHEADPAWRLDGLSNAARRADISTVLIESFGVDGINGALVIGRPGAAR